jgi:F0F1-type ATP synthase assembly protein I
VGRDGGSSLGQALELVQSYLLIIAPMLGFGAVGYWLDGRWGTKPWLLAAGLVLGMVSGMTAFLRTVTRRPGGGGGPR